MNNILEVKNIQKSYATKQVIKDLSFTIKKGETIGLLGPNGAGKTTTLDLVLGIKNVDQGSIRLYNHNPIDFPKKEYNRIGVQFQHSFFPDYITVSEICQMTNVLYTKTDNYHDLLKKFGLGDKEKQKVQSLSGGEKQKLAVLLALLNKPEIVFLDELTTGLDPQARRDVWDVLKDLKEKGLTIFLTSHYMDEVEQLCDKLLIINDGILVFQGTSENLKTKYNTSSLEEAYLKLLKEDHHA